jgi:pimeloyl-ACP methyl ester carboxylesterase
MKTRLFSTLFLLITISVAFAQDSGTLQLNDGGAIYYETMGEGTPIVFLHGGFGDRRMWNDQFAEFAKNYFVVRYDERGFGKSAKPTAKYSPVSDLEMLLDHLKIDKAHLVGNSLGGILAIDFAILKPSRVRSLTVVGAGPSGVEVPKEESERMMAILKMAQDEGVQKAAAMCIQHPMLAITSKLPTTATLLKTMIEDNASIFQMKFWPFEQTDPPAVKRLNEINVPVLIVVGDKDTPGVHSAAEAAATGIAGSKKVVMKGADHLPQMDNPEEFNRIVKEFLSTSISCH